MTLAAVLCCTVTMTAEPVSPSVARQAAAKFLQAKGAVLQNEAMQAPRRAMGRPADGQQPTEASPYYVFNASASQGFVVVSGDDCVGDNLVLGYTAQGSFDADNVPANLKWWFDAMASQITEMSRQGAKARAVALHDDIAPLVTTLWDQGSSVYNPQNPYNALCPKSDEGLLSVTGCAATALAQVLNYHRWPQEPLAGPVPAYSTLNGTLLEELPPTAFDWDNMVDDYHQPTTEAQQMAVATLMRYCGQMLTMDYTPNLSNALFVDMDMITNLFGYAPGASLVVSDSYTVSGWNELIYNELHEGRPLFLAGWSTGGGHAFVVDGYEAKEGSGYYHVNWGWGGLANGFFKISLLNPDSSGTGASSTNDGYSSRECALIGLQPAHNPQDVVYRRYLNGFFWNLPEEKERHNIFVVNPTYKPGTYTIALAGRNADGTPDYSRIYGEQDMKFGGYTFTEFSSEASLSSRTIPMPGLMPEDLPSGQKELVFVNREAGTDNPWQPLFGPNCYIEITDSEEGQPADTIYHPLAKLTSSSRYFKIEGVRQRGLRQIVTAPITNNSDDDIISTLELAAYYVQNNQLTSLVNFSQTGIQIESGTTENILFNISVPMAGTYVLLLTHGGKDITGTNLSNIKKAEGYIMHKSFSVSELTFYCQSVEYDERPDDEGNEGYYIDTRVGNLTSLDYDAVLLVKLYRQTDEGNYEEIHFPDTKYLYSFLQLKSNTWDDCSIRLPEPLEPGDYGIDLFIANDFHSLMPNDYFIFASGPFTIASTVGITEMDGETDATRGQPSVVYDLQGRRYQSELASHKKGIYVKNGKKIIVK